MTKLKGLIIALALCAGGAAPAMAFDIAQALKGGVEAVQAITISDSQIKGYVSQYVQHLDATNKIAPANSKYTQRLNKMTQGLTSVDGIPLNFKVYITSDVNAFACADGSVRVYSGLMDLMSDDEVLGVIGHEIGHVAHKDTKKAFKTALLTSAARNALGSTGGLVGTLSNSQLGALSETLVNSKFSRKQEQNADEYGYDFLKKSGKNPWAMAMAFKKLMSLENGNSSLSKKVNQLFSDHPATADRIKNMEKRCRKDGIDPPAGYTPLSKK